MRGIPLPPRSIGISSLKPNRKIICAAQSVAGKILVLKKLPSRGRLSESTIHRIVEGPQQSQGYVNIAADLLVENVQEEQRMLSPTIVPLAAGVRLKVGNPKVLLSAVDEIRRLLYKVGELADHTTPTELLSQIMLLRL